jgi:hypothetical protein
MPENEKLRELLKGARDVVAGVAFVAGPYAPLLTRIDAALAEPVEARDYTFRGGYVEDAAGDRWWSSELLARVERERDEAKAEVERLNEVLEDAVGDMHMRIRAGYDKTIADTWRAKVAEVEKERDEARAEVEFLRGVGCNELDGTDVRGPCGACLKCARRERDEARARCEKLRELADIAAAEQGLAQRRMLEAQQERDEARAVAGLLRDMSESDIRMLRATEAALDLTAVENEDLKRKAAAAFKRGAEAMREAAAKACEAASWKRPDECADDIRDLKIPEDK